MTEKITNGDYVKNGNSLAEVQYIEELLQNAALSLQALRGSFYPDKNYGSLLGFSTEKSEARAVCYARQALSGFDGIYIKSAKIIDNVYAFTLTVNGQERQVSIKA
ncbi:MAG: hypothetical protein J1E05_04920 [Eubacterium sp.]|nr:hypothetical protein [Eubacterium sp.]